MDSETVGKVNEECKEGLPEKCTGRRRMRPKERKARACEQAGECQHSKVKGDDGCWCVQGWERLCWRSRRGSSASWL